MYSYSWCQRLCWGCFFPVSIMENSCQREGTSCSCHLQGPCGFVTHDWGGRLHKDTVRRCFPATSLTTRQRGGSVSKPLTLTIGQARNSSPLLGTSHVRLPTTWRGSILINPSIKMRRTRSRVVTHHAPNLRGSKRARLKIRQQD